MTAGVAVATLNAWLNALCRSTAYSDPTAFYLKLHTGDPGAAGTANAALNTSRQQATFAAASAAAITTSADLVWTSVPSTETYAYWSAWDASTNGTFLCSDALATARPVTAGDTFTIPAGDVDIAITPVAA